MDGQKTLWLKLGVDSSNKITRSKSRTDVGNLVQLLSNATTVELEVAPYAEASIFVSFDISTFTSAQGTLIERCK